MAAGRRLCAARPVGLRQDHAAQHHFRHRHALAGQGAVRRQRHHPCEHARAQHCAGVPVPGDLRHHDGGREPCIPVEEPRPAARQDRGACRRDREAARSHALSRPQGGAPVRRRQAENLAGPRPGAPGCCGGAVRRTADGDRSASEVGIALQAESAASGARPHHDLRYPRPDRGADLCRYGGGDA